MMILAIICGVVTGLLCSILGRHAGTMWAVLYGAVFVLGIAYSQFVADDISYSVASAALVSFGSAKVLHDITRFLERPDVRTTT